MDPGARNNPSREQPAPWWPAPIAYNPVDAVISVPGSKSATNRALILAALADGPSTLTGALEARDTRLMIGGLQSIGIKVEVLARDDVGNADLQISPGALTGPANIDVGLAGTVMRFLPPVAALGKGVMAFDGDPHARTRPMSTILDALRELGASVTGDRLPFQIQAVGSVRGGDVTLDSSASSQFVSALLLAGARFDKGLTLTHVGRAETAGKSVPSRPHIDMTIAMLAEHGVIVDTASADSWHISPQVVKGLDRQIEPDLSNAAPFLAAALATRGKVTILDWPVSTTQPGDSLRDLLQQMGAVVAHDSHGLTVTMNHEIRGIDVNLGDVGELTPTIAAMAALASSPSHLHGIAHLRGHETDRLDALARELTNLGCDAHQTDDGLVINPRPLHGGQWRTYADHRMATAGAIIGLVVPGIEIEDIATTDKTLPDFPARWAQIHGVNRLNGLNGLNGRSA